MSFQAYVYDLRLIVKNDAPETSLYSRIVGMVFAPTHRPEGLRLNATVDRKLFGT